jgi:hypothetical protein
MAIVGYWRLNGNSNDASGNGYNGTDANITYSQAKGVLNGGAGFAGNSYIRVGTSMSLPSQMTVSFFANRTSGAYGTYGGDKSNGTGTPWGQWSVGYGCYAVVDNLEFLWANTDGTLAVWSCAITISNNKIYHIIFTRDSSRNVKLMVNGKVYTGSFTVGSTAIVPVSDPKGTALGVSGYDTVLPLTGFEDEFKVQNTELSYAQMKNEYLRVKGFF